MELHQDRDALGVQHAAPVADLNAAGVKIDEFDHPLLPSVVDFFEDYDATLTKSSAAGS
jgi:hypothetical protein